VLATLLNDCKFRPLPQLSHGSKQLQWKRDGDEFAMCYGWVPLALSPRMALLVLASCPCLP
jgi:hypothetical protein